MKDRWHWLRHKWSNWKLYKAQSGKILDKEIYMTAELRQQRYCLTCRTTQDEYVSSSMIETVFTDKENKK